MATRSVSALVATANGTAREGACVEFVDSTVISALTDAGGVFVVDVDVGTPYGVSFPEAVQIDGLPYPAALLSTPDSDTKAFRLYHADGFVDLARGYHFPGDVRPFAILGATLPLRPGASRSQ